MDAFGSEEEIVSKMLAGFLAIVTASWTRPVHCVSITAGSNKHNSGQSEAVDDSPTTGDRCHQEHLDKQEGEEPRLDTQFPIVARWHALMCYEEPEDHRYEEKYHAQ